jgi:hypothetical protein
MKTTLLSIATLIAATLGAIAEEAPKDEAIMVTTLLEATQNNDLQKFESVCDETMKTAMTAEKLTQVSGQISPIMKQGFKKVFMGVLNRGAVKTYYWKIVFDKEGTPEMLAELSIRDGKAAGFFIR